MQALATSADAYFVGRIGTAPLAGLALRPDWWAGLFSKDPAVLASGYAYLQIVGPCYVFLGAGMALYFAAQGFGRMLGPVLASTARLAIAAIGGYVLVLGFGAGLETLFGLIGLGMAVFGLGIAAAVARGAFHTRA